MWLVLRKDEGAKWSKYPKIRKFLFTQREFEREIDRLMAKTSLADYVILKVSSKILIATLLDENGTKKRVMSDGRPNGDE